MKRVLATVLCAAILLSCLAAAALAEELPILPGSGTQEDPYRIATKDDLLTFFTMTEEDSAQYGSSRYILTDDIALNSGVFSVDEAGSLLYDGAPITEENAPVQWQGICGGEAATGFSGSFDGQGHTVSGLYGSGLFGLLSGAEVKNLNIGNAAVTEPSGILCRKAESSTAEDCTVSGYSAGSGLLGAAIDTTVLRCINNAAVSSRESLAGGICGMSAKCGYFLCENNGSITVTDGEAAGIAGGIIGSSGPGDEAALCTNRGAVTASGTAGGICGTVTSVSVADLECAYTMNANIGTVSPLAEGADGLGIPAEDDGILLLCSYTADAEGGSYHGMGEFDANTGRAEVYTDAATGEEKTKWIYGHKNETVSGVDGDTMKAPGFPALVNDNYAYILDGSFYQFASGTENGGYPVVMQRSETELTGGIRHKNFVDGTGDGMFSPTKVMTRAEMAQIFYAITPGLPEGPSRFPDVPDGKWFTTAVNAMAQAGFLSGYTDGTFGPNRAVMRCELVQVLARMSGAEFGGRSLTFTDVADGYWAFDAIALAQERGWVTGVGNNTFLPLKSMTRAEAVTAINAYLGHKADIEAIAESGFARFFPDVQPDAWYYPGATEAATTHTVISTNLGERWISAEQYGAGVPDGFYLYGGNLFAVEDGMFITRAGTGVLNGISYTCSGSSGICLVGGTLLPLANGTVCVLQDGKPCPDKGFFEYAGDWYYGQSNCLLICNGTWETMRFDAEGKYTSGNERIDEFVDQVLATRTDPSMTQEQKLRACYDYVYSHINYQSNNNHVPHGADPTTWTEEYMLRLLDRGKGNCYCFAAEMYYFARRIGYWQARAISGQDSPDGYRVDHGWLEIEIDGVRYLFDPEMNYTRKLSAGRLFMKTYSQTPWSYYPYY